MRLFKPVNMWLNDPRVFRHGGVYYCVYGSGPYPVPAGDHHLSYRIARSEDLVEWTDMGVAIAPRNHAGWDDLSIWTPGFLFDNGTWHMYYTALSSEEKGRVQRIGLARSTDLEHWERHDRPVINPDPHYYETDWQDSPGYGHVAWRDPAFIRHEGHRCWYGYITARGNDGPGEHRGCIALVRSTDLMHWENLPAAYRPDLGVYFEVPQVIRIGEQYLMLMGDKLTGSPRVSYCVSDDPLRWSCKHPTPLLGGPGGVEYSGWAVMGDDGYDFLHLVYDWADVAYRQRQRGYLSMPKKLILNSHDEVELLLHPKLTPEKPIRFEPVVDGDGAWRIHLNAHDFPRGCIAITSEGTTNAEAALVAMDERYRIRMHNDQWTVVPPTEALPERTWTVSRKGRTARIDLVTAGRHIDLYADRRFLCTLSLRSNTLHSVLFEAEDGHPAAVLG